MLRNQAKQNKSKKAMLDVTVGKGLNDYLE